MSRYRRSTRSRAFTLIELLVVNCDHRHRDSVNAPFLDWSVRKLGLKELWTLNWGAEFNRAGKWTKAGGVQPQDWPAWMRSFKDY